MDAVEQRTQLLQRLQNAVTNPDSINLEAALDIYAQVWNETYYQVVHKLTSKFWGSALTVASSLVMEKNWEEIQKRIKQRKDKEQVLHNGNNNVNTKDRKE